MGNGNISHFSDPLPPYLTWLRIDSSIKLVSKLPPSLSYLDLSYGNISNECDLCHSNLRYLRFFCRDNLMPRNVSLPQLERLDVYCLDENIPHWLPLFSTTPMRSLLLRGPLSALSEGWFQNMLPPTLTSLKSSFTISTWGYPHYRYLRSDDIPEYERCRNLLEVGPEKVLDYAGAKRLISDVVENPHLIMLSWFNHTFPNDILTQLPSKLLHLSLIANYSLENSHIKYFPATLLSLHLPDNVTIGDEGIEALPRGMNFLEMAGDRRTLSRRSAALLPPVLTRLRLKYVHTWQDSDIKLLPRTLTRVNLKNLKDLTNAAISNFPDCVVFLNLKNNRNFTAVALRSLPSKCETFINSKNRNMRRADFKLIPYGCTVRTAKLKRDWDVQQ